MTDTLNIFGALASGAGADSYAALGLEKNLFRVADEDVRAGKVPFYEAPVATEMKQIAAWVDDVHLRGQRQPLTLMGNIGVGKTLVVGRLSAALRQQVQARIAVKSLLLSDAGYGRISVGSWLMTALDVIELPWLPPISPAPDVLPLVAHLARQKIDFGPGRVGRALAFVARAPAKDRDSYVRHLSTWLRRGALTEAQARTLGVGRRLDWEGELIPVLAELLTLAREAELITTFFLFIDQVEDLFGPGISATKRSRVLSDLRGLIDYIAAGAPIGLLVAATPDLVERSLTIAYPALATRLQQRRVDLPLLEQKYAEGFTETWLEPARVQRPRPGVNVPKAKDLANAAWEAMRRQRQLMPPGEKAVQRFFLTALADDIDRRAGLRD